MSHRWRPPGTGWIRTHDHGSIAVWMCPEQPGGVTMGVYLGDYYQQGRADVWIVRVPRTSALPHHVMDKPHRIRWVLHEPDDSEFGGIVLVHDEIRATHAGHRRTKWTRKVHTWPLPRPILTALDDKKANYA